MSELVVPLCQVNPGDSAGPDGALAVLRDIKSLSGGEKSFATTCLLLALWEGISSPIRCLDEVCDSFPQVVFQYRKLNWIIGCSQFDVFQDAVNRRISLKLLVCVPPLRLAPPNRRWSLRVPCHRLTQRPTAANMFSLRRRSVQCPSSQ